MVSHALSVITLCIGAHPVQIYHPYRDLGGNNMNEREKIKEVVIDTKIYDPELPQKVRLPPPSAKSPTEASGASSPSRPAGRGQSRRFSGLRVCRCSLPSPRARHLWKRL